MNDLQYNLNQNSYIFIQENASENILMVFGSFFGNIHYGHDINFWALVSLRARFMGPTSGPYGDGNTQLGPMLAP